MQIAPHVAGAETVDTDDIRAGKRDRLQLLGDFFGSALVGHAVDPRPGNFETRMQDENRNDDGADGVRKPEFRHHYPEQDGDKHRDGTVGVATVVPGVRFDRFAADGAALGTRIAEKDFLHDNRYERHDSGNPFRMGLFPVLEGNHRIVTQPHTHGTDGKPDTHRNQGFKSLVPVRVVLVGRRIPELGPHNDDDVGNKIRCTVDGVCHQRLRTAEIAGKKLTHRQDNIPAQPYQRDAADLGTIIFFYDAGHRFAEKG